MAANIPFTSLFDDGQQQYDNTHTSRDIDDTVLDNLQRCFPHVSSIVHRSGLQSLYTSADHRVTIFVPNKIVYDAENMSTLDAIQFCRNMTTMRFLDRTALNYYGKFILKTLSTPYDLSIESFPNGLIKVNGFNITSSIECRNGYIHVVDND